LRSNGFDDFFHRRKIKADARGTTFRDERQGLLCAWVRFNC
jgi:hypothetical protein